MSINFREIVELILDHTKHRNLLTNGIICVGTTLMTESAFKQLLTLSLLHGGDIKRVAKGLSIIQDKTTITDEHILKAGEVIERGVDWCLSLDK